MTPLKKQYLDRIRSDSAYPAFRSVVNIIALLLYAVGILLLLAGVLVGFGVGGAGKNFGALIAGIVLGLFYVILGKIVREVSLMLADVADSITDLNSRNEGLDQLSTTAQTSDLGRIARASEEAAANSQANADLLRQLIRAYGHEPEA
jgi:hypothetical protein